MSRLRLALMAATALVAVSCSAGSPTPTEKPPESPTGHGAFAECLHGHGVPAPPGPAAGTPEGVDEQAWQQAMTDCASLAPGPAS